jgi:hypothetical protein
MIISRNDAPLPVLAGTRVRASLFLFWTWFSANLGVGAEKVRAEKRQSRGRVWRWSRGVFNADMTRFETWSLCPPYKGLTWAPGAEKRQSRGRVFGGIRGLFFQRRRGMGPRRCRCVTRTNGRRDVRHLTCSALVPRAPGTWFGAVSVFLIRKIG